MKILSTSSIVALAVFTAAPAWAICTPATVNPGAVQRIMPRMSVSAAQAVMGCSPKILLNENGITILHFTIPFVGGGVFIVFDSMGAAFAEYLDPAFATYNGALRVEPPLAPNWMPSAGALLR